jgi:hypothetical protein
MNHSDLQTNLRHTLNGLLQTAQKSNSSYSLRALAKRLQVSSGGLCSFLQGKKQFSQPTIDKIIFNLQTELNYNINTEQLRTQVLPIINYKFETITEVSACIDKLTEELSRLKSEDLPLSISILIQKLN